MWPDVSRGGSIQSGFQVRIMKLQVHHPKLLAIFLLAIAAVTVVGVLFASGGDDKEITSTPVPVENYLPEDRETTFNPIPVENPLPVVSEESLQEALLIAKASGVLDKISGNQEWTHDHRFVSVADVGGAKGVRFDAVWEEPVESDGPWQLVKCKNTRLYISLARWTNITRLSLIVDLANSELVHYAPIGEEGNEPVLHTGAHPDRVVKLYDTVSGELVFEGTANRYSSFRKCTPGKEEEEGK